MPAKRSITRALISVSDKSGVETFARGLQDAGVELLSTGGSASLLRSEHLDVVDVADHTGFPEIMAGRVKTLHPRIHGGILGRRGTDDEVMQTHNIRPIDLVAVNLYPFDKVTADPDCTLQQAIENIDIGGPAMLRAAAKNYESVLVLCDPDDYPEVLDAVRNDTITDELRFRLAVKAYSHTAGYDTRISSWLSAKQTNDSPLFPARLTLSMDKTLDLRYGENPHQQAAFYRQRDVGTGCVASATTVAGQSIVVQQHSRHRRGT